MGKGGGFGKGAKEVGKGTEGRRRGDLGEKGGAGRGGRKGEGKSIQEKTLRKRMRRERLNKRYHAARRSQVTQMSHYAHVLDTQKRSVF